MTIGRPRAFNAATATRRYAWYVVGLLTATQVVSYIDRFLPSLLLESIKSDLALTDFQVGLLMGPAFGLFYVFVGVPIGWLADRYSRRAILATGISIWCAMTATAGLVRSFVPLFLTRMGVGLGEATMAPCSVSLISDYFPRERRAPPLSLFMAGTFLGAGTAFLLGGPLVHHITSLPPVHLPILGDLRSWQLAFLVVGLPGFVLAGLMFTIREPRRQDQAQSEIRADAAGHASLGAAFSFMRKRWTAFGVLFIGSAAVVTMGSLSFWNVALFARTWGWSVRDVGIATGVLFFIGGPIGTLLGIALTRRWVAAGHKDATLRALWIGLAIAVPGFALYPIMPSVELAIVMQLFAFTGQAMAAAAGPASITLIAPGQIKSQATAIYYLCIGIFGQLLGPPPVGFMTDLFGDPNKLRYAMTIEAATIGILALVLVALGLSHYRRCVIEVDALIAPGPVAHV
ncbi:MAG TPA: MFS transporter [Steroidobacteraceae bacterium]|nr:MFS transporter [Steroidobacteraceae bacterium]HRX89471.1 MFS transporter [Steroidobacteraceae bacterium]